MILFEALLLVFFLVLLQGVDEKVWVYSPFWG